MSLNAIDEISLLIAEKNYLRLVSINYATFKPHHAFAAVSCGDLRIIHHVVCILDRKEVNLSDLVDDCGYSLLTYAIHLELPYVVLYLLTSGVSTREADNFSTTNSHIACLSGSYMILVMLALYGEEFDRRYNDQGLFPIHLLLQLEYFATAKAMLQLMAWRKNCKIENVFCNLRTAEGLDLRAFCESQHIHQYESFRDSCLLNNRKQMQNTFKLIKHFFCHTLNFKSSLFLKTDSIKLMLITQPNDILPLLSKALMAFYLISYFISIRPFLLTFARYSGYRSFAFIASYIITHLRILIDCVTALAYGFFIFQHVVSPKKPPNPFETLSTAFSKIGLTLENAEFLDTLYLTYFVKNGTVDLHSLPESVYYNYLDSMQFINLDQVCLACWQFKNNRTKHCSSCDTCVEIMDHHCGWLGNCIGLGNRVSYFWFVILAFTMLACHIAATAITFTIRAVSYLNGRPKNILIQLLLNFCMIFVSYFSFKWGLNLVRHQIRAATKDITYNEHVNAHRYPYAHLRFLVNHHGNALKPARYCPKINFVYSEANERIYNTFVEFDLESIDYELDISKAKIVNHKTNIHSIARSPYSNLTKHYSKIFREFLYNRTRCNISFSLLQQIDADLMSTLHKKDKKSL